MAGTWSNINNAPSFGAGTMLLLTDGDILVHDESGGKGTHNWWRFSPDASGSYKNGTWKQLANGPTKPLYFACSVLRDGRVFIAGGEYEVAAQTEQNTVEIYDPVADSWTNLAAPAGWTHIGDAPSAVLPDGRVLIGDIYGRRASIYDPVANTWTATPNKDDTTGTEETWVLLQDQSVLALECKKQPRAEKYIPAADTWVSAGSTPVTLVDTKSLEIGSAILLPDGRVFCIGATNHTALYTPPPVSNQVGTWAAGPDFPTIVANKTTGAKDAPAALLPNGRVLCIVAPYDSKAGTWGSPLHFYEYDPVANTLTAVTAPSNNAGSPYSSRLMLLPNGEVLHTNCSKSVAIYTPDGSPDPVWKPSITSVPNSLKPGFTYTLHGRQINGLSQAVIYGDEGAMATNYPMVRITHNTSGHVHYCRTHDHSTMGVNTGTAIHSTRFTVPAGIDLGASELCVVANGIESACIAVNISHLTKTRKELKVETKEIKEVKEVKERKEVKEVKEHIKQEVEQVKPVFENKRKDMEHGVPAPAVGDWSQTIKQIVERSDALEEEVRQLRAFILKEERPDVGTPPAALPPTPARAARRGKSSSTKNAGKTAKGRAKTKTSKKS